MNASLVLVKYNAIYWLCVVTNVILKSQFNAKIFPVLTSLNYLSDGDDFHLNTI